MGRRVDTRIKVTLIKLIASSLPDINLIKWQFVVLIGKLLQLLNQGKIWSYLVHWLRWPNQKYLENYTPELKHDWPPHYKSHFWVLQWCAKCTICKKMLLQCLFLQFLYSFPTDTKELHTGLRFFFRFGTHFTLIILLWNT